MGLTNSILGTFLELCSNKNLDLAFGIDNVRGVNNQKQMMSTKADLNGRDLSKFQIVCPGDFVFNHRTSRNGSKFSIAYNDGEQPVICTEDYVVFRVRDDCKNILSSRWLYMFFNRPEFDRYVITNSWGSSTEFYNWEDIQAIELTLPDIATQQKYVNIYNAMLSNQQSYERGLEDLKLVCDAYIEDLRRQMPCEAIGAYIGERNEKNENSIYGTDSIKGISINKEFITTKANTNDLSANGYKLVLKNQFAFNPNTARMGEKICVALNNTDNVYLVSSIYPVFEIVDHNKLFPEYLMMWFKRSEFDRYVRFNSWGSARETFDFPDMLNVEFPIPDIEIQKSIANIYRVYIERKRINEQLKSQIKNICPVLIKGSIEEGRKTKEA